MGKPGIYCIENWSGRRANRNSVRPVLEFLETSGAVRFIHERVSTLNELEHRLDDWAPRRQHAIGHLALHGSPESVYVGRHELSLEDLLLLDQGDGQMAVNLKGKTLYLASCYDPRNRAAVATRSQARHTAQYALRLWTRC